MNIGQIEENLHKLADSLSRESFIYDLLLAYGLPKASIARLQKGTLNLSKVAGEIIWKKKLFFREVLDQDLHGVIDELRNDPKTLKHSPRFIVITDYQTLLAVDTKTNDTLDITILDIAKHYDFFLPWAGMEKAQVQTENPADVKAAERMAKLFDEIRKDNPDKAPEFIHGLNVFLSRLLFCFFAEDTNIFVKGQFTNAIKSHTQEDGSDLATYLERLFDVLNAPERNNLPAYLAVFPYVNGGLFRDQYPIPQFSRRSRQIIIESGDLDWSAINPDIFGSMFQAVVSPELRGGLGMHYTSVPNIMKVIEPLFLNELKEEFTNADGNGNKLNKLLERLKRIKIFDPACGSGNFLIIAYKELRRLEMEIFEESNTLALSGISLAQFYGIEIDDFACEIAILSLWLAEHQMNVEFFKKFGRTKPTLPLHEAGHIVCGNAIRLNWEDVCPKHDGDEIYILGNPPYLGSSLLSEAQKDDMGKTFNNCDGHRNLDYISCWFLKGAKFIDNANARFAFVSTNSICQGEQVAILWPLLLKTVHICFAYTSFKWSNNARSNAGVTCVIIGIENNLKNSTRLLFTDNAKISVNNISPYLTTGSNVLVSRRSTPVSAIPEMTYGNKPVDGGNLILSDTEKNDICRGYPQTEYLFKNFVGSAEFIKSTYRWCLWIEDNELDFALSIPPIASRIEKVKEMRLASRDEGARKLAERAHQFRDFYRSVRSSIIIPCHSSENRDYIPMGFLNSDAIISNAAMAIYDADPWIFGVITSKMHMTWVRTVGGRLKTDYRYSAQLCYNTFPFPKISQNQKDAIEELVFMVLEEREKYPEKTLAQLYDPDKMPAGLKEAHHQLDLAVERCYRSKPFDSDEERLEYLFKLYEKMILEEKNRSLV